MEILFSEEVSSSYLDEILHIITDEEFLSLSQFVHHHWTNRLMHSMNVSYVSWLIAKKCRCDTKIAARAGLLHDFCPYDFHMETPTGEHQLLFHPKIAAENSVMKFGVNQREFDAILTHMFPFGPLPHNKEAWIITLADKLCAFMEVCHIGIGLSRNNRVTFTPNPA